MFKVELPRGNRKSQVWLPGYLRLGQHTHPVGSSQRQVAGGCDGFSSCLLPSARISLWCSQGGLSGTRGSAFPGGSLEALSCLCWWPGAEPDLAGSWLQRGSGCPLPAARVLRSELHFAWVARHSPVAA